MTIWVLSSAGVLRLRYSLPQHQRDIATCARLTSTRISSWAGLNAILKLFARMSFSQRKKRAPRTVSPSLASHAGITLAKDQKNQNTADPPKAFCRARIDGSIQLNTCATAPQREFYRPTSP